MRWLERIVFWAIMVAALIAFGAHLALWLVETVAKWALGEFMP